jgi:imidazole glycerol-phosphate synthase subunit HisH
MKKVAIIDLGSGNLNSVVNVMKELSIEFDIIQSPNQFSTHTHIILPGVGAFDDYIKRLEKKHFFNFLRDQHNKNKTPILGICIGMHVLGISSEEGIKEGLGLIPGRVVKLKAELASPHMGWNEIKMHKKSSILNKVDLKRGFYYLHKYKFEVGSSADLIAASEYGCEIQSIISNGVTFGIQFHPEKSHSNGLKIFYNFINI